jgi:hypothetical protein
MRRHDWAARMFEVIQEHATRPFDPVLNHCCMFPARVVDAMTDSEHVARILAECPDESAVAAFIERHGGLRGAVSSFLGEPTTERAMRGDVVQFDGGLGDAIGVWDGRHIVATGETGLRRLPREEIKVVWRVS